MAHPATEPARLVYDSLPHAVLVLGRGGHLLHANQAAEKLLATRLATMRARRPHDIWHITGEDGEPLRPGEELGMAALVSGEADRGAVRRLLTPDRRWLVLEVDSVPSIGADGASYQVVCTLVDATARYRVEALVLQSQREWRELFQNAGFGIARLDLTGRILTPNPAFCELLGYQSAHLEGRSLTQLVHPEDAASVSFAMLSELERRKLQSDLRYLRADGEPIWVNSVISLARDAAGRPSFLVNAIEDIRQRKAHEAELEHRVQHDILTGLPNRARLSDLVERSIEESRRQSSPFALLVLDLDGFKAVNDTRGHLAGDELLKQVAKRLRAQLRRSDTVARIGGDEFAVILPGIADADAAAAAGRKLAAAIAVPYQLGQDEIRITGCAGAALFPGDGDGVEGLVRKADAMMYAAKRDRYAGSVRLAPVEAPDDGRAALADELRRAIDANALMLHYQPQVDLESGSVTTVEALLRWPHPTQGLLTPDRFLPLAEASQLIQPIEFWVVGEALRRCREWRDCGLEVRMAVNLSGSTLSDARLPDHLDAVCEELELEPGCLQIEVTQSALAADPDTVARATRRLAQMQVQIAIDDFGVGRASLDLFRRLRSHELKIARSFVLAMTRSRKDAVIVESAIELGRNLGVRVVALGVEDEATRDMLVASGCELAQGFFVAPPVPADQLLLQAREASRARSGRAPARPRGPVSFEAVDRRRGTLEGVSLLMSMSADQLRRLARNMTELDLKPSQVVDVGATGAALHVIEAGTCEVVAEDRPEQPLMVLGAQDVIGPTLVAGDGGRFVLRAVGECRLLTAGADVLASLLPAEVEIVQHLVDLAEQRRSMTARLLQRTHRNDARNSTTIAVCSSKGGAGKTTIALNLAAELANRLPDDVLLVDLGLPYNDAALLAGLAPTTCLARMENLPEASFEMALRAGLHRHRAGFSVLSTALRPEEADLITPALITRTLALASRMFGCIVVDLGVALSESVLCVLETADAVVPVVNPELTSMKDSAQLLEVLGGVLRVPAGALHMTVNHRSAQPGIGRGDIERLLRCPVAVEITNDGSLPEQAALRGDLVVHVQPRAGIARAMAELAGRIATRASDAAGLSAAPVQKAG